MLGLTVTIGRQTKDVRLGAAAFFLTGALVLASGPTAAAPPPTPKPVAEIHPEWAGTWVAEKGMGNSFSSFQGPRDPRDLPQVGPEELGPLKPEIRAAYLARRERASKGMKVYDPMLACMPPGMPGMMAPVHSFLFGITPTVINWFTHEFNENREIYVDGRPHPAVLKPSFTGHSVGHWEGDTLVIDTVGISTQTGLSRSGIPHSDQLHLTERVRMLSNGELEWRITADDPGVLTAPWSTVKRYIRVDENDKTAEQVGEYVCEDNRETEKRAPG